MRALRLLVGLVSAVLALTNARGQITRAEVMAKADAYLKFRWQPTAANAHHGLDQDGIQVDTPDGAFARAGTRPGWWVAGAVNTGMPYQWGGFSTPEQFTAALRKGAFAGDVYSLEKRRLNDAAVSKRAIGIDCSGLVSRCWGLPRAYSTKELPEICTVLGSYAELKAGDILNSPENHVLLFKEFTDATQKRMLEYEAGSPPSWKVLLNSTPVSLLQEQGYRPLRYRKIRD